MSDQVISTEIKTPENKKPAVVQPKKDPRGPREAQMAEMIGSARDRGDNPNAILRTLAGVSVQEPTKTEGQQQIHGYGFKEVKGSEAKMLIDKEIMPWLSEPEKRISLAKVTLKNGESFLYGSAIEGKILQQMAEELGVAGSEKANKLFYAEVQRYLENRHGTKMLDHPNSNQNIRYASNGQGGIRVYFMELDADRQTGLPVIIRVAASQGKSGEIDVLGVLTPEDRKTIAKRCLGK